MFKFGLNRTAAVVVRACYLVGLYIGVYLFFQRLGVGNTPAGEVLSFVIPGAVLLHEFLQQQAVLSLFRQWLRNQKSEQIRNQLLFHSITLSLLTLFDGYCVWQISPATIILPVLFFLSSVLVEADEDAAGILARNALLMLLKTTRTTAKQWKRRIRTAQKKGINLAPISALLMADVGNTDDARRVRMIDTELSRIETSRPNSALAAGGIEHAPKRHLFGWFRRYSNTELSTPPGQAQTGATRNLDTGNINKSNTAAHGITTTNKTKQGQPVIRLVAPPQPRKRAKPPAEQRVRRILERTPDASLEEIARRAHVGKPTAKRHRETWLAEQQTMEATR